MRWLRDQSFTVNSGAALATVVGVLIEVSVVAIVNRAERWYEGLAAA